MFGKLKEKLKSWAKKISKEEEKEIQEVVKTKKQKSIKQQKKEKKIQEKTKKIEEKLPLKIKEDSKKESKDEKEIPNTEEKKSFFKKLISGTIKISEKDFEEYSEDLEMSLLENNVALEVSEKIINELKEKIVGQEFSKKEIENKIKKSLKDSIQNILVEPFDLIEKIKNKNDDPYVILFCGINGSGKTTTIAKLAYKLQKKNISCIMAAADTFRAAAIDQIKTHGKKLGIEVISHEYGTDPASVGFDAIKYSKKNKIKCVLIDTAGRIHTSKNLLAEIQKISRVCNPDTKIFVGESITGNDSIEQVKSFDEAINLDGIILSKADIDEKGGTALSVGYITKKPILYLGTGQEYEKIEIFNKEKFIEKLGL